MARNVRRNTNLEEDLEVSPFSHKYLLKRPITHERSSDHLSRLPSHSGGHTIDNPAVEKRRFELFIDLIWVGVIGNIAENFSEKTFVNFKEGTNIGDPLLHFILLYVIAWRFWKALQEFMSKYRTNDLVERSFVVWALLLAMVWGNNAPYLFDEENPNNYAINVYLIWRASLMLMEIAYSFHIPHIRRRMMVQAALIVPVLPLWIAADCVGFDLKQTLALWAIALETVLASSMDSPLVEQLLHEHDRGEKYDTDHWVERISDFYIIILGEGVLSLIRGSPLGPRISDQTSGGVFGLLIYYCLSGYYFNGDSSQRYVHAVKRTWWRKSLWVTNHSALFGASLIIGVSVVFLLQHPLTTAVTPNDASPDDSAALLASAIYWAKWTVSINLSITLLCQTVIALLNRSLDGPGSLKVSNRYLRLIPRMIVFVVSLVLPIPLALCALAYLGILTGLLLFSLLWEWISSLERGGGLLEP